MHLSVLITCLLLVSVGHADDSCQNYPEEFHQFVHDSILSQIKRLNSVPYGCVDPDHFNAAIGTQESHWDVINYLADVILENAGPQYPDGIIFAPSLGGLPVPTGAARQFMTGATDGIIAAAKKSKVHLCDSENHGGIIEFLQKGFDAHYDLLKPYLLENCATIKQTLASNTAFQQVSLEGAKAVIKALPEATKYVNDPKLASAIANLFLSVMFDSQGGRYVFLRK